MKDTLILGIETSCDETSVAVIRDGKDILSNLISSQVSLHRKYGGVVPEIASRKHLEVLNLMIRDAIEEAKVLPHSIDAIAVTYGPGLEGALLIGVAVAKVLSYILEKPLIGINHIEGHIYANFLNEKFGKENSPNVFPCICLVVSGGHTDLILMSEHLKFEILGRTRDDAAGEAFDKAAKFLQIGFPGGPVIDKLSKKGDPNFIKFPRAYLGGNLDFSFSGLKTALINYLKKNSHLPIPNSQFLYDICASYQKAIIDVLVKKTIDAAKKLKVKTVLLGGGVSVNSLLRKEIKKEGEKSDINVFYPEPILCIDNAAMIACCGYYNLIRGKISNLSLDVVPNLSI